MNINNNEKGLKHKMSNEVELGCQIYSRFNFDIFGCI